EDELAAVVERDAHALRQAGEAGEDQVAQLASDLGEAVEAVSLVRGTGVDRGRVDEGQRPVADSLGADGARLGEAAPGGQRLGPGEAEVARDQELVVSAALCSGEHGAQSVSV